jgi:hypothetical protein
MDLNKANLKKVKKVGNIFARSGKLTISLSALPVVATPLAAFSLLTLLSLPLLSPGAVYAQGYPQGQMAANQMNGGGGQAPATNPALLKEWFNKYDMIRKQAQMTPAEKAKADDLMSHGLQMFVPGEEKVIAQKLLTMLVGKYQTACNQLKLLPLYPETGQLHRDYFKYFSDAHDLFADYLKVQNNLMAKNANGQSIMAGLMQRKADLEATEQNAKSVDAGVRGQLGIAPYRY